MDRDTDVPVRGRRVVSLKLNPEEEFEAYFTARGYEVELRKLDLNVGLQTLGELRAEGLLTVGDYFADMKALIAESHRRNRASA